MWFQSIKWIPDFLRVRSPAHTLSGSCAPRWAVSSSFCPIFTLWFSMRFTPRSLSSPSSLSQVSDWHESACVPIARLGICFTTFLVFSENLLAGLPQQVKFTILTGHYTVKKGDALQLSNTDSMPVLHSSTCTARILSSTGGEREPQRDHRNNHDMWHVELMCVCDVLRAGGWERSVHTVVREGDEHLSSSDAALPHAGVPAGRSVSYPIIPCAGGERASD